MIVRFPIIEARRGDYCKARIAGHTLRIDSHEERGTREAYDTANGRYWKCEIMETYPKGILKVKTQGHRHIQLTHVGFVLDGEAWGSRMREEIEELQKSGKLIEKPR
jgi:hypothetical protein